MAGRLRDWAKAVLFAVAVGLFLAFGHSVLAMSGAETLAQVYREVESPKLKNFKKAALVVFVYSVVLTAGISFLAVLIIPDEVRMKFYSGNLISGLARHVWGPPMLKLALETFVVVIGFIGAYTTFSTFEYETMRALQDGQIGIGLLYVGSSVLVGFFMVWVGSLAAKIVP